MIFKVGLHFILTDAFAGHKLIALLAPFDAIVGTRQIYAMIFAARVLQHQALVDVC